MKIITNNWKTWVVGFETIEYPWSLENKSYFASPIYLNNDWKLEIRRAWADWCSYKQSKEFIWYSKKDLEEIKESIEEFIKRTEIFYKWEIKETQRFKEIIKEKNTLQNKLNN